MEGIDHCSPNYGALSPSSFLERAASVYGERTSIVHGSVRFTWRETLKRCLKLASALVHHLHIDKDDIVATFAPNIPALYELHFGVPMAGAVISALNTNLDATKLASTLELLEAKLIFVDYQFKEVAFNALDILSNKLPLKAKPPCLVLVTESDSQDDEPNCLDYDTLLEKGQDGFSVRSPDNELDPISVNFTSGSTGDPKGVVYSHRAAYLNSLAGIFRFDLRSFPVFLWTVDMFRCNGWCIIWTMAALGGTNICVREVSADVIFSSVFLHRVTCFCGSPRLLNIIADAPEEVQRPIQGNVDVIVAGVLPNCQVILKVEELGFRVIYGYGMTEALGPAIVFPWRLKSETKMAVDCEKFPLLEVLHNVFNEGVDVKDPITMKSITSDGKTIGEVMFKSNTLMSGYFKNSKATEEAFKDGWYRTRDLGVRHPSGLIEMKDREKDVIICGDGNIVSTLEVEGVLLSHPKVLEAAVVGKPDVVFKGVPCGFVKLKEGVVASPEELIEFCRSQLPSYMVPKMIFFGNLPVNFNGKVQKFILREKANAVDCLSAR